MDKESFQNRNRIAWGQEPEYSSVLYGISPNVSYMQAYLNGPAVPYDPVEKLVGTVSQYRYLGSWRDPDRLMEDKYFYNKVLACGRWELAKQHILQPDRKPSLSDQITSAENKAGAAEKNASERPSQNHSKNTQESPDRF